jgi:hypothetical protein
MGKMQEARTKSAAELDAVEDVGKLQGWCFIFLNLLLAVGNVIVLSNVPSYYGFCPICGGRITRR